MILTSTIDRLCSLSSQHIDFIDRPMIEFIRRNNHRSLLNGIEIGVRKGMNAKYMLKVLKKLKTLYLIDPYIGSGTLKDKEYAIDNLKKYSDRIHWIFCASEQAVNLIPEHLDFVYIDGNHDYDFVLKDIMLYYPKIRTGGILGGHDYSIVHTDVVRAVDYFVSNNDLKLFCKRNDWWMVKK